MSSPWFVVQTQPHAESRAALNLVRQGYDTYFPRYLKRRRHARRTEIVPAPLFPRYLFVRVETAMQRWRSISSTFGVARLVSFSDTPAIVPSSVIDLLKHNEDGGLVQLRKRVFTPGERVRITEGAFTDCIGLFEGMRDEERVCVLLDLLGRKVRVVLDELALSSA
jgi:transcriptional antiterminator RfaH